MQDLPGQLALNQERIDAIKMRPVFPSGSTSSQPVYVEVRFQVRHRQIKWHAACENEHVWYRVRTDVQLLIETCPMKFAEAEPEVVLGRVHSIHHLHPQSLCGFHAGHLRSSRGVLGRVIARHVRHS